MTATLSDVHSIAAAKARIRIENQRANFAKIEQAIRNARFYASAIEFRKAADKAIARSVEFEEERLAFESDQQSLAEIRAILDVVVPDAARDGRSLTDAERVAWIVDQWKTVSRALGASE